MKKGCGGGRSKGVCFKFIHKSGIPQLSVLKIYPSDSHNTANVISRVNVPPQLQWTHYYSNDTLHPIHPQCQQHSYHSTF